MTPRYAELQVTSPFSFLHSTSSAEELFAQAALYGIEALGITDHHSLAGIVRAHEAARTTGVRLVVGSRLDLADGTAVLAYPTDRPAYARLCRLLTLGKRRAGKGRCQLNWSDLVAYGDGLIAVWTTPTDVTVGRGMSLTVGQGPTRTVPFAACGQHSCEVRAKLAPDFIAELRRQGTARTAILLRDGRTVTFEFSPVGLAEALDRLGV